MNVDYYSVTYLDIEREGMGQRNFQILVDITSNKLLRTQDEDTTHDEMVMKEIRRNSELYPPKLLYVDGTWLIKNQSFIDFYMQKMERGSLYDIKSITKITIYPKKLEISNSYGYGTMSLELVQ